MKRIRDLCLVTLAAAVLWVGSARAQPPTMTLEAMKAQCPKTEDVGELKTCVKDLLALQRMADAAQQTYMDLVEECLEQKTLDGTQDCIRKLTGPAVMAPPVAPQPSMTPIVVKPEWRVTEEASRMDGSATVFMSLSADEPVPTSYGTMTRPSLHIRCRERATNLFIAGEWFLGNDVPVMFRLDKDKPVQQTWQASSDSKAAGLWNGGTSIPFIKAMLGREQLLVRVTPYRDGPREMAFSIGGLAKAVEPLRKACGW